MDPKLLLDPSTWAALPVIGGVAMWVGRLHQRVNNTAEDVDDFKKGFTQHMADDARAHERLANIEGQVPMIREQLNRIEQAVQALHARQ